MVNNKFGKYLDFFLYAFLAIGIAVFVVKQLNKSEIKSFDSYPKTELKFNFDTLINMGKVTSAKPIIFSGFIKNIGNKELHIANLRTSCGCTNFSIKDTNVKPMDSTMLSFTIKPIEQGKSTVNIYFDANTKQQNYKLRLLYEAVK